MTTIMQIYLTILLGLIVLTIIFGAIYKTANENMYDNIFEIFDMIYPISFILTSSWIVYMLLALIWHWF